VKKASALARERFGRLDALSTMPPSARSVPSMRRALKSGARYSRPTCSVRCSVAARRFRCSHGWRNDRQPLVGRRQRRLSVLGGVLGEQGGDRLPVSALRRELKERKIRVSTVRIHYVASEFLSGVPAELIARPRRHGGGKACSPRCRSCRPHACRDDPFSDRAAHGGQHPRRGHPRGGGVTAPSLAAEDPNR